MERQPLSRRLVVAALAALVLAASAAAADAPVVTVTQTLPGLDDVGSGGFEPPDVQVAAGPGYVVEMVNLAVRVWRTGAGPAQAVQTLKLAQFFASGDDNLTDPRIVYDAPTGRWLASISDLGASGVRLAVSATGDPTGRWTLSSYVTPGCADQPRLGIADGIVVLGADIYRDCEAQGSQSTGSMLWVVNKEQLLAGSTTPAVVTYGPDPGFSSFAPAQSLTPTAIDYVVSVNEPFSRIVHVLAVDGVPPGPVAIREVATPSIARLARPSFAAQPPGSSGRASPGIETNDNRVLDSVWANGSLWLSANDACIPAGDTLIRSCGRIIGVATGTLSVVYDNDLSVAGAHVFFPAIRPDAQGDLVIVYGESGVAIKPQVVVAARMKDGTFTQPAVVAQSAGAYLGDRYGDYFGAGSDPTDPAAVWVAGEAGTDILGGHGWSTTVASVAVTPAGGTLPAAIAAIPPGVQAVRAVSRIGKAVQLTYRSLDEGLGVRTIVTVRSKKQQLLFNRTTPRSDLHAGELYFVQWRPAKELRGTFAYCVHTMSASGDESASSCTTITLR